MKALKPAVSVIIPVYNGAKFISACYKQLKIIDYSELEFVFIDNNSEDHSLQLLREFAQKDPRIQVHTECKRGAGTARNTGISHAKGEILSFLDIDDKISPNKISRHVQILVEFPEVAMVFGQMYKFYPHKNSGYFIPNHSEISPGIKLPPDMGLYWLATFGRLMNPSAVTCRKKNALEVGGFEDGLLRGEDAAFHIKMGFSFPIFFLAEWSSTYVRHNESTISIDNRNATENPYYTQFRDFYLPYFTENHHNPQALRIVYRNFTSSLMRERKEKINVELKKLHQNGFLKKYTLLVEIRKIFGFYFAVLIYKVCLKLKLL